MQQLEKGKLYTSVHNKPASQIDPVYPVLQSHDPSTGEQSLFTLQVHRLLHSSPYSVLLGQVN